MDLHYPLIDSYMFCNRDNSNLSLDTSSVSSSGSSSSSASVSDGLEMNSSEALKLKTREGGKNSGNSKPKKSFECTYCKKVFNRPSALQTHTYSHTAEKPFQCLSPNCGRSFSVASNLRRHFKVHQKAPGSNKLSSEDRLRCVKRLMQQTGVILTESKQEGGNAETSQRTPLSHVQPSSFNHYRHNFLLPASQENQNYGTTAYNRSHMDRAYSEFMIEEPQHHWHTHSSFSTGRDYPGLFHSFTHFGLSEETLPYSH